MTAVGMNAEQLLTHFDRIANAPDAVPRLRRFVLDLAVRGRLVEQDPNDEPASEMLKRIKAEKARLVDAGEIKKPKALPAIDEPPFHLPKNWHWTRIREATSDRGQTVPQATFTYIDVTAIDKEAGVIANPKVLKASEAPSRARKIIKKNDVIYSCVRPYLLNVAVVEEELKPAPIASTAFAILNGHGLVSPRYLWIVLRSPFMVMSVQENQRGQSYPAINEGDFAVLPIPFPPLAEQRRIVAKVDELMTLCDRLDAARTKRETIRTRLAATSLAHLNTPDHDPSTFQSHIAFAIDNLTPLTTRHDQIKTLRQTILNLAVSGKLVPQDPNDKPASELLKRIEKENKSFIKSGKTMGSKHYSPAIIDDLDFDLRAGWVPTKFRQILIELQTGPFGSTLHQNDYEKGGTPVINPASVQNECIVPIEKMAVGPVTLRRLATFRLRRGDIVMGRRGEMGRCAEVTQREDGWLCGTGSLILRLPKCVYPRFFVTLLGSPYVREYLGRLSVGATMQNLNQSILLNLVIGLPPLAEQRRIVAKVDELMVMCERLWASLATGDETRRRLLDAVLHEVPEMDRSHS